MHPFHSLSSHLMLAPMAGVTDKPFRQMVQSFGSHLTFSEMLTATSFCYGSCKTKEMMDLSEEKGPVSIQIVGNNPLFMAKAAKQAEKNGAFSVDINMGCPVRKITEKGGGSALMLDFVRAAEIVEAVKEAISLPVTVKTRLNYEDKVDIVAFCQYLEQAGADAITLHGRTKEQGYSGKAVWEGIAKVKKEIHIPLIANGDIVDAVSVEACRKITNADGFMIGRAALGKPWILTEIENGRPGFVLSEVVLEHFDRIMSYYGHKGLFIARKHLAWYATGYSFVAEFRQKVYAETDEKKVRELIRVFFDGK